MAEDVRDTPEIAEKKSRGLGSYVVWAFVAVMLYVLSSGPVYYIAQRQRWYDLQVPYYPLSTIYRHTAFHKPLGMYWHMWVPSEFEKTGDLVPKYE
jgi:hypothetical protein